MTEAVSFISATIVAKRGIVARSQLAVGNIHCASIAPAQFVSEHCQFCGRDVLYHLANRCRRPDPSVAVARNTPEYRVR